MKDTYGSVRYEFIKSSYRQSGWKAKMPAEPYASEFTQKLHNIGYKVIILTARPYKEYYTIYPDTLNFLKDSNIYFDAIIWDENKHLKIIKEFPNLSFLVDDSNDVAIEVAKEGYNVFEIVNKGHNILIPSDLNDKIKFVHNLQEIINLLPC
jgi:hypothetical protein